MSVSIVIPCYNEEEIIEKIIRNYYAEIISKIYDSEFIVVDDCSNDNTAKILEALKAEFNDLKVLKTTVNSGHGEAIRMGYEFAKKEYIFQIDSDNQFEIKEFWKLYSHKDKYDFILGIRTVRHDPLHRLILSTIIKIINFLILKIWLRDANCPFRLIKKEIINELLKHVPKDALAPNLMLSLAAKKKGIRMLEMPITHYKRNSGVVSIANWKLIIFSLKGFKQILEWKKSKSICYKKS